MVYHLAVLVIIPIILGIVVVSPFEEIIKEEPIEEPVETAPTEPQNGFGVFSFILFTIWLLIVIRVLYKLKRGTFKIRTKF